MTKFLDEDWKKHKQLNKIMKKKWNLEVEGNKEIDLLKKTQIEMKLKSRNLEWQTKPQK